MLSEKKIFIRVDKNKIKYIKKTPTTLMKLVPPLQERDAKHVPSLLTQSVK